MPITMISDFLTYDCRTCKYFIVREWGDEEEAFLTWNCHHPENKRDRKTFKQTAEERNSLDCGYEQK